jgi:hypothetical protein
MSYTRLNVRPLFFSLAAASLILGGQAIAHFGGADSGAAASAAQSPFFGEWELDLTRMPDNYGPPPKRVVFTFADAGSGMWRTSVAITARDDSVRHMAAQYRRDGRAVQTEGDQAEGSSGAVNSPAPNVLVMNLASGHGLDSVRVYAISADGREMTESAAGVDTAGVPFVRNFHFRRIR